MKCNDCGHELNKYLTYSEKNETYYCMNCCHKHVDDDLVYIKIKNNQLQLLNIGVSAAGIGKQFQKLYTNEKWILRHDRCEHLQNIENIKYPIFYCSDGKIICSECFYDKNIDRVDPLMKSDSINENGDNILLQFPFTYEPHNLEFSFECDDTGIKGEEINGKIIIKNNKQYPIKNIQLNIESYATPPWDGNKPYGRHWENNYSKLIIYKEFKISLIESNDSLEISTKLRIPQDNEINENQIFNSIYGETLIQTTDDEICDNSISNNQNISLKIPKELMIFANFNYKTQSGYEYKSTIEAETVNIR